MRPIKFRAWNTKGMIHSGRTDIKFYVEAKTGKPYTLEQSPTGEWGMSRVNWEIMQCTDLEDENGKEIWEGDVLDYMSGTYRSNVFFRDGSFCMYIDEGTWLELSQIGGDYLRVIGNIYKNPELIEESK